MVNPVIVLAAGGTGGHTFPAEALAQALRGQGVSELHLITNQGCERFGQAFEGVQIHTIRAGSLAGNVVRKVRGLLNAFIGIIQARKILATLKPQVVVGFGGYPSFPTLIAAKTLGIPSIVHEQNALLGRTNRKLAGWVQAIATSFAETAAIPADTAHKAVLVGNPVRGSVLAIRTVPYAAPEDTINLLVMGGSGGASVFSQVLPVAIGMLPVDLRKRLQLTQQSRKEGLDYTRATYEQLKIRAELATFFTDVPERLAAAHLVIARAGASTMAELLVAGRPALLVPYPHAQDDHQMVNARFAEAQGAAWVIDQPSFTAEVVSAWLESLLRSPDALVSAAGKAYAAGNPDAAQRFATLVLDISNSRAMTTQPIKEAA